MAIEGFGENTVGGTGGSVLTVTNLNDSGAGSLRAAIDTASTRIVRFSVSGIIDISTTLSITDDNITIEGDSAPAGGICIRTDPAMTAEAIEIKASEVIIQHLRIRPGPSSGLSSTLDAVTIRSGNNIAIDHCSLSFSTDEVISLFSNPGPISNVTLQWCIIAWGLVDSTHTEGTHSMGLFLSATAASANVIKDITVHHCLLSHNRDRNPFIELSDDGGVVDFANNVMWNYGDNVGMTIRDNLPGGYAPKVNIVKIYDAGDTVNRGYYARSDTGSVGNFYVEGNFTIWHTDPLDADELTGVLDPADHGEATTPRHTAPALASETGAFVARDDVLANAGAFPRDSLDDRVVRNTTNLVEQQIDDPIEVNEWPDLTRGGGHPEATSVKTDKNATGLEPAFLAGFGDEMFALPAQDIGVGQTYDTGAKIKTELQVQWAHLVNGETAKLHFRVNGDDTVSVATGVAPSGYS